MANRYAVASVATDLVALGQPVTDPPTKEHADRVPLDPVVPHQRPLRPAARMQTQVGVVVRMTVLDQHVVTNLPTDPVAVVVPSLDTIHHDPVAVLQENAAAVVPVQIGVLLQVPVQSDVPDRNVVDMVAGNQREQRGQCRFAREPEVLAQGPVQLEPVPRPRDQGPLQDVGDTVVRIPGPQHDAVANLEPLRVRHRHLLVVPVTVVRQ